MHPESGESPVTLIADRRKPAIGRLHPDDWHPISAPPPTVGHPDRRRIIAFLVRPVTKAVTQSIEDLPASKLFWDVVPLPTRTFAVADSCWFV